LARTHEVRCLTFTMEPSDRDSVRELEKLGIAMVTDGYDARRRQLAALPWLATREPLTLRCFASRKLAYAAREYVAAGIDAAIGYSSCMAQFYENAKIPRIMEFGDLDSEKWLQYAGEARGPARWIYGREARTLLAYERKIAREFDVSLVVSPAEAKTFEERTGVRAEVVGNGVDFVRFRPDPKIPRRPGLLVFTGIMDYRPNVEGCVRFATRVLPKIRAEVPDATFRIVGAHPSRAILELRGAGVEVTGAVAEPADHLREASVAVAPLRLGRGLQNKVLEAMACATPIVVSPNAGAGIDAADRQHYLVADSDDDTARAVISLLRDPAAAAALGERGRARVAERYPWDRALADYDAALALAIRRFHDSKAKKTP
jgi:sugar transferase (PEP-CTERM/EpsH1 system associated)